VIDGGIIGQCYRMRAQKAVVCGERKNGKQSILTTWDKGATAFVLSCDASTAVLSEMVDTERMYSYQK
jgi:hypothetical protein